MKWTASIPYWLPFAMASLLCWMLLEDPAAGWIPFYSFLPMTFFFVGAAFFLVEKRVQALEARVEALERGSPAADRADDASALVQLRRAPLFVMAISAIGIGGGLHGDLAHRAVLLSVLLAILLLAVLRWLLYRCPHCHQQFFVPVMKDRHLPLRRFMADECVNCGHVLHRKTA